MLDYLKKFNSLPAEIRQKVAHPSIVAIIEALEKKYQFPLAALIMRVMVKEIPLDNLAEFLLKENLEQKIAYQLARELREKIFFSLGNYLSALPAAASRFENAVQPSQLRQVTSNQVNPGAGLSSGKSSSSRASASFFFSAEDEAEIKDLAKKIDLAESPVSPAALIEVKLRAIIDGVQINFGSAELANRFKDVLRIYLRGIRNKLETKMTLVKPFTNGGLSFDEISAQKVIDIMDKILNSPPGKAVKPQSERRNYESASRDTPYDFSKLTGEKKPKPADGAVSDKTNLEVKPIIKPKQEYQPSSAAVGRIDPSPAKKIVHELAPLTPLAIVQEANKINTREIKSSRPTAESTIKQAVSQLSQADTGTGQSTLIKRRFQAENLNISQKVKVEDVKYIPKVMSPLDELRYMDLVNFRRLDKDPFVVIKKIQDKINLLAEENYGKRLEGIKFWRSSPVNQLYLEIGHLSIGGNKPVDVIINERKTANKEYLNTDEFKAIMDLNKSLRF